MAMGSIDYKTRIKVDIDIVLEAVSTKDLIIWLFDNRDDIEILEAVNDICEQQRQRALRG